MSLTTAAIFVLCLLCVGCGAEDATTSTSLNSPQVEVLNGRLVGPVMSGVKFKSGAQSGITDEVGSFKYEADKPLFLEFAGVPIPEFYVPATSYELVRTAEGATRYEAQTVLVTPADYSENDGVVLNVSRLGKMLDVDGNPTNDVRISESLQQRRRSTLDWNTTNLESAAAALQADAIAADGGPHLWSSEADTRAFLAHRRECALAGVYAGSLQGQRYELQTKDPGGATVTTTATTHAYFVAVMAPSALSVYALFDSSPLTVHANSIYQIRAVAPAPLSGPAAIEASGPLYPYADAWPTADATPSAAPLQTVLIWEGNTLAGSWSTPGLQGGQVSATRAVSKINAAYRFVHFPVTWRHARGHLMFAAIVVDISRAGQAMARLIDVPGGLTIGELTGSLAGASLTAVEKDALTGTQDNWKLTATLDLNNMTLAGSLYQWDGSVATDFTSAPIAGCSL